MQSVGNWISVTIEPLSSLSLEIYTKKSWFLFFSDECSLLLFPRKIPDKASNLKIWQFWEGCTKAKAQEEIRITWFAIKNLLQTCVTCPNSWALQLLRLQWLQKITTFDWLEDFNSLSFYIAQSSMFMGGDGWGKNSHSILDAANIGRCPNRECGWRWC